MSSDSLMGSVDKLYENYKQNQKDKKEDAKMEEEKKVAEDEEMKDENEDQKRERIMAKFGDIIERDKKVQEEKDANQRPLSRAYLSICPFNKDSHKNTEEEKNVLGAYQVE